MEKSDRFLTRTCTYPVGGVIIVSPAVRLKICGTGHFLNTTRKDDIGWHSYMDSWVKSRPLESEKVILEGKAQCLIRAYLGWE